MPNAEDGNIALDVAVQEGHLEVVNVELWHHYAGRIMW